MRKEWSSMRSSVVVVVDAKKNKIRKRKQELRETSRPTQSRKYRCQHMHPDPLHRLNNKFPFEKEGSLL